MNDSDLEALLRVARRVSRGEALSSDLMGQEGVGVALRLVLAVVALTAADQPVTKSAILAAAPAARSATYRDHATLLEDAKELLPALVRAELGLVDVRVSVSDLADQLQAAYAAIRVERARREKVEMELEHVVSYARELHWKLKAEREEDLRERERKVRHIRPVPSVNPHNDS